MRLTEGAGEVVGSSALTVHTTAAKIAPTAETANKLDSFMSRVLTTPTARLQIPSAAAGVSPAIVVTQLARLPLQIERRRFSRIIVRRLSLTEPE